MPRRKSEFVCNWNEVPVVIDLPYVARLLGCSIECLRKACQKGEIPAFKVGDMWRIDKDALISYIKGTAADGGNG